MSSETQDVAVGIDIAMKKLRGAMTGIQIRRAGFRKDHDNLTRAVSSLAVTLVDATALLSAVETHRRRRR
jgi:hypothetical protein